MIISNLLKKILPLILKQLMPELRPLQKYVYEKNELDQKMEEVEKKVEDLEKGVKNLLMTCKAIDSKIDATFKMKKKFK